MSQLQYSVVVVAVILGVRIGSVFNLGTTPESAAKGVLIVLATNVLLSQYFLLGAAGVRCAGRPAVEVAWGACSRLGEGAAVAAAVVFSSDIITAAAAVIVNRIVFTTALFWWLARLAPWLQLGTSASSPREIKRLFHPSVSYMLASIGGAFLIQGPVIVLALVSGPLQVVVFSTSRTLARLGASAANILNFSATAEYSRQFGLKNFGKFRKLLLVHLLAICVMTLAYVSGLEITGGVILRAWTHGKVDRQDPFFIVLVLSVGAEMVWSMLFVPISAINRHVGVSYVFVAICAVGLGGCYIADVKYGLTGVAFALLGVHVCMLAVVTSKLVKQNLR